MSKFDKKANEMREVIREEDKENISYKQPKWFKEILKNNGTGRVLHCQDHTSYTKDGKVIFEPYGISMLEVEKLIDFCKNNNLCFEISGRSQHFPCWTIKIILTKINKEED